MRDKPIEILLRTKKRMREKDPSLFQWDIFFLSNPTLTDSTLRKSPTKPQEDDTNFDQLMQYITDKKIFHRKGRCLLRAEKGERFIDVTLILTGDHLYYIKDHEDDSVYFIFLSDASLCSNSEKTHSFEIISNGRRFVIACKSQHDMDNWISAILTQIEHTKCKHVIMDLENRIQHLAKDASKDEAENASRKQFLTYLESLEPQKGSLLQEYINAIHNYK